MRIERRTVTVKLGESTDQAVLIFDELKENTRAKINQILIKAKDAADNMAAAALVDEYRTIILGLCLSVDNLSEGDKPVTVEDVKSSALYSSTINAILAGYIRARDTDEGEAGEKNVSGAALSKE